MKQKILDLIIGAKRTDTETGSFAEWLAEYWVEGCLIRSGSYTCILRNEEKVHPMYWPYLCSETGCIDGYAEPVRPETVGQYTGLTDKNGKKIFEGDILKWMSTEIPGSPCVVEYGDFNCSCCDGVYGWYFRGGDIRNPESYIVIGNIHDNPELLEVGGDGK